jgi:hypothetical protein
MIHQPIMLIARKPAPQVPPQCLQASRAIRDGWTATMMGSGASKPYALMRQALDWPE